MERNFSEIELLAKARNYCARQEHCNQDVRNKIYAWGGNRLAVENIISQLIGERFLNEARYAEHFALSKFRQKGWGKRKIENALKAKQVSSQCITLALKSIEEPEYETQLKALVLKRWDRVKETDPRVKRQKVFRYFLGKGYSAGLIERTLTVIDAQ